MIDEQWNLKVGDFGFAAIGDKKKDKLAYNPWTAPELMTEEKVNFNAAIDVYAMGKYEELACLDILGIILWEILESKDPLLDIGQKELVMKVKYQGYRPPISQNKPEYQSFIILMRSAWDEKPSNRPTMASMLQQVCRIFLLRYDSFL